MAKTPEEQIETMITNMPANTGKSLDQWLKIVAKSKLEKHGEICNMLKKEHGVGHGYANLIAHRARGSLEPVKADGSGTRVCFTLVTE